MDQHLFTRTRESIAQYVARSLELRRPSWLYNEISDSKPVGLWRNLTIGTFADDMGTMSQKNLLRFRFFANFLTMATKSKPYEKKTKWFCYFKYLPKTYFIFSKLFTLPSSLDLNVKQRSTSLSANPKPLHDDPNIDKTASEYSVRICVSSSFWIVCLWKKNKQLKFRYFFFSCRYQ